MELKLGKITNKELAEWMGITANTFNKSKEKYLRELENFANFHIEGKKVVIDKIINPIFSKQGSKAYQMVRDKVDDFWSPTGLDSCKNVSNQIVEYYGDRLPVGKNTAYDYTRKGRNELYGVPFEAGGKLGKCVYTWCKKEGENLIPLTEEEQKIKELLIKKYFGNTTEKQILIAGMVEMGEIKKEEAWDILSELTNMKGNNFLLFLGELQEKIGCKVVRGTLVQRNQDALGMNAFYE